MARRRGRMKPYSSSNEGDNSYGSGNNKTYSSTSGDKYDSSAGNYGSSDTSGNHPSSTTATKAGYNLVRFVSRFACTNWLMGDYFYLLEWWYCEQDRWGIERSSEAVSTSLIICWVFTNAFPSSWQLNFRDKRSELMYITDLTCGRGINSIVKIAVPYFGFGNNDSPEHWQSIQNSQKKYKYTDPLFPFLRWN